MLLIRNRKALESRSLADDERLEKMKTGLAEARAILDRLYFAKRPFIAGVLEGLEHFGAV